jgi:hypothetical protein
MPFPCHAVPLPCRYAKGLDCVSHLIYTVQPCLIHTCHVVPLPYHDHAVLKATFQGHGTVRHGNGMVCAISNGNPETAWGSPVRVRLLPATTRSFTKVVTRSKLAVRIFRLPRGLSRRTRHCQGMAGSRHGMWISAAGERHRNGMVRCELALIMPANGRWGLTRRLKG